MFRGKNSNLSYETFPLEFEGYYLALFQWHLLPSRLVFLSDTTMVGIAIEMGLNKYSSLKLLVI
jgi:hypothetical protein